MTNPLNAFVGEAREAFIVVIIAIMGIIVLATIGTSLRMQALTDQMINSISWGVLLYLALPSTALIILIIWIVKKFRDSSSNLPVY